MSTPLRLATTTSTNDTGLLSKLRQDFLDSAYYDYDIAGWESVGTGAAIALGQAGLVDVLLTHARVQEEAFVTSGAGLVRTHLMYNEFLLVGPAGQITPASSLEDAFGQIAAGTAAAPLRFVSRHDSSGTNIRELDIWDHLDPPVDPNLVAGYYPLEEEDEDRGMMATLILAGGGDSERNPNGLIYYTLTDNGTWLKFQDEHSDLAANLQVLSQSPDPWGLNQYAVTTIDPAYPFNPAPPSPIDLTGAEAFVTWLLSAEGKESINTYTFFNTALFTYNADEDEPDSPFTRKLRRTIMTD
ncbi:MAG: substrate-binding domain-containing protein [Gracilibacteraceae bacterium]|jgi:tungstate transport system substrate-binding protein|nr:substrate-binding domain-containing protein [Gracilibacteraceae bacterium]